jgi:hypothetical protein
VSGLGKITQKCDFHQGSVFWGKLSVGLSLILAKDRKNEEIIDEF